MKNYALLALFLVAACAPSIDEKATGRSAESVSQVVIGEPNVLNVADWGNADLVVAQTATLNQTATLQSLSFYVTTAAGKLRLGIYDASGPGGGPGKKLSETGDMVASTGWNTASVTPTELGAGTYWIAYLASDNNLAFVKVPGNSNSKTYRYSYGAMPSTFTASPGTSGSHWSMYATLTVVPNPPPPQPPPANTAPTLSGPASASPTTVSGKSTQLSALGSDDGGEAALTYTWTTVGTPPAPVSFSPNGNNSAKNSTAAFASAGSYAIQVTAKDSAGLTAVSSVTVTVGQSLTSIDVSPSSTSVQSGATQQFNASSSDQFGHSLASAPTFTWSASGGTVSSAGLFTAGANTGGSFTVNAVANGVSGGATVAVTAAPVQPQPQQPAEAPPQTSGSIVLGESDVLPLADHGHGNLMVAQAAALAQPATIQSMSFYITAAAGRLRLGVYDASGPEGGPGHKITETNEFVPTVGWNTAAVPPVALSAGTYWLVHFASDNNLAFVLTGGNANSKSFAYGFGVMPATFAEYPSGTGAHWSLYATLGSGGQPDPCASVSCNAPPAAQCVSATVLRSYSASGTCSAGSCSYASVDTTCPSSCQSGACVQPQSGGGLPGPLRASANSNYFQDTNGHAVALFGSHTWNDFQDWGTNGSPQALDFSGYTSFLKAHGHNFTMLWRTELPKFCGLPTMADGSKPDITTNTQPWVRSGPGTASDGKPRFDLNKFDQSYFDRLRSRVSQLNDAGVWVAVYLFSGEWLNTFRCSSDGYPFTAGNNVNSIDDGGGNGSMTMSGPNAITAVQDAMMDKTIDTLNDLPNVLWIVSEEAAANTTWWQQHAIAHVRSREAQKPYRHPVGLGAMEYGTPDSTIIDSSADWVSPFARISSPTTCGNGSPACKVNINDSDHSYFGMWSESKQANRQYAWENFARGNQVAFMDPYTVYYPREGRNVCASPANGVCAAPDTRWDNFRDNLGYLASYSRRMNLNAAHSRDDLCSTSYCLGQTPAIGTELLVYAPTGGAFSVKLSSAPGRTLNYEWFDPNTGKVVSIGSVQGGNSNQSFSTPSLISADSVLYIVDSAGHG